MPRTVKRAPSRLLNGPKRVNQDVCDIGVSSFSAMRLYYVGGCLVIRVDASEQSNAVNDDT
ncbi:MAG: hypothetical protein NVSMB54_10400 [Ktedonobacteraceae bacterium]